MSASREKQKRRELIDSGAESKETRVLAEQKKSRNKTVIYSCIAAAFIIAFVLLTYFNSDFYYEHKTAATVGDTKVSVVDFDYYYRSAVNNYASYFGDYWSDYSAYFDSDTFVSTALSSAQNTRVLLDAAKAEGKAELSDEDRETIESTVASYETYASYYGYASADGFMEANFGKGCSLDSYQDWLEEQYIASSYATEKEASFTYTEDDIDAYYEANASDFDTVTYRSFFISSAETDDLDAEEAAEQAAEKAQTMADQTAGNENAFVDLCIDYSDESTAALYEEDADYNLATDAQKSAVSTYYADWLFEDGRQGGETTAIETDSGWYVVYFVERSTPDYNMVNVRHVLISVEDSTDEDEVNEAYETAQTLLNEWAAGDATEETFAEMADTNSSDGAEGGLYENVCKGDMVTEFNDWIFDESRQVGDTDIVQTSYGWHIMYFVGEGDAYLPYTVEETMRENDYSDWYSALAEEYPTATVESGLNKCSLTVS